MEKVWYILIGSHKKGPYSLQELQFDHQITPHTFVWREGFVKWLPAGEVWELRQLFENQADFQQKSQLDELIGEEELILDARKEPPFALWILLFLMLCALVYLVAFYA